MAEIELRHVGKNYGHVSVLDDISLEMGNGEFVVLVGPSGCGKSTLLRMIAGLEDISSGQITMGGKVINNMPAKERDLAMVFQNYALYPHMKVAENMSFALKLAGVSKAEIKRRVDEAAEILGLEKLLDRLPRELSGGQRQRVAMGRAIVRNPRAFLFDEPLSNLDAKLRVKMRGEIKRLHQRLGKTMIYVTHDQTEAMTMADKIVVLNGGNIEQAGAPLDLYKNPVNLFVASFIGSPEINLFNVEYTGGTEVTLHGGQALPLGEPLQVTPGTGIVYGIRPQHITLADTGVPATVLVVEPTGDAQEVLARIGEHDVSIVVRDHRLLNPDEVIHLHIDPAKVMLFEKTAGDTVAVMRGEPKHFNPAATGPLTGIRVLDLSRLMAGNMLSLQLADFGADVIKIESPDGDPLRDWKDDGHSLFWKTYGRNKRSVALNLRHAPAMAALWALVDGADVFIENFRPGTLEAMGLAPEALLQRNPDLIVVRISGFGQTGPYAQLPGFGTIVEAMSGFADRTGFPDREPVLPPLALADMIAGIYGASATTMALFARQAGTARGQVIDLSLLEPMFSVLGPEAAIHAVTGKIKQRVGSASNTASPRNVYACADGKYLALSGSTPAVARRIFDIIGRSDMNEDPRFATNSDRVKNRALVDAAIGAWFAERDSVAALAIMRKAGATVGPIYNIADAMADAHFAEREIIVDVDDADFGTVPMHDIVPRLSGTPGVWRLPAPAIGEHTRVVLAEAGLDDAAIDAAVAP